MKKLIRSAWFLATLAVVLGVGTQAVVLSWRLGQDPHAKDERDPNAPPEPPTFVDWSFITPEVEAMRTELKERLDAVTAREKQLQDYELRLKAERAEIEKIKREIERIRQEVGRTVTDVQAVEQKNLKTLANSYATMTPTDALAIFREMDDEAVVKIMAFMKPDQVGLILQEMARTKEGDGTLAGRAAVISNKLRLLNQVRADKGTRS